MRIVVIGASSGTGKLVVEQGLARGDDLVAISRSGTDVPGETNIRGDAGDPAVVRDALGDGADAVVLAIGGAKGVEQNRSRVTAAVLDVLPPTGVGRVIVHSSLGAGDSGRFLPAPMKLLTSVVLAKALADHTEQEKLVTESGQPWTIVRPGGLRDSPATGNIAALEEPARFNAVIARADVAAFILDCAHDPATAGHAYALGTPA